MLKWEISKRDRLTAFAAWSFATCCRLALSLIMKKTKKAIAVAASAEELRLVISLYDLCVDFKYRSKLSFRV